jgi:hypothetical protein
MRPSPTGKTLLLTACICVLISACASTARGIRDSVYQPKPGLEAVDNSRSNADAMVIIRYPAVIHEDAEAAYYAAFTTHYIGGRLKEDNGLRQDMDRVAQAVVIKSNYYAMSLYRELRERLPGHAVLLSPHIIELEDGQLTSSPLLAAEQVPAVFTIDFSVYSYPDPREMMNSEPLTLGDLVTPLFVVHTSRWLSPPTHGLLLSSEPMVVPAWRQSRHQADRQVQARLEDTVYDTSRPLDFVSFLEHGDRGSVNPPLKSPGASRAGEAAVEVHPLEKIQMNGAAVAGLLSSSAIDPFADDFARGAATRVVKALNRVDHDRATFFSRQIALSRFDPALGEAFLSRSRSENLRARLAMGEALIEAEKKFLAQQSESLYQGTYEDLYGDQMRQMIAAEYRMLEERRELARAQNWNTALAIVALAGAAYAGANSDSGNFFKSRTAYNLAMMSSIWAMNSALSKRAQSRTYGENFLLEMAPAINRQVSVQLEWLDSRQEITARNFAEFRDQTLSLYQRSVRSLSTHTFDPRCRFISPELDQTGRWFGLCREGLGFSSGFGLIVDAEGKVVEYIGNAEDGLASGAGAMIVRPAGDAGARYYEGSFARGLPNGAVRVEEPGREPRVRVYRDGRDRGSADEKDLRRFAY